MNKQSRQIAIDNIKKAAQQLGWELRVDYDERGKVDMILIFRVKKDGKIVRSGFLGDHNIPFAEKYITQFLPNAEPPPLFERVGSLVRKSKDKMQEKLF